MGTSRLKIILAERDIQIKELAAMSGVPYDTCIRIVNGRKPHIENAYAISECLHLHIDRVFPNLYSYANKQRYKHG